MPDTSANEESMALSEAQPAATPPDQSSLVDFSFSLTPQTGIYILLCAGLVIRLALALLPGFGADVHTFRAWADELAQDKPWHFYEKPDFFIDYAPGYLYFLWFIGEIQKQVHFTADQYDYVIKLPPIMADLASAYLLYRLLDGLRTDLRLGAAAVYLFFPPVLFIGAVWGQVDSLVAFFLLLSVYFIHRDRPVAGGITYVVAFLVKPQVIAALPFLAFWVLKNHPPRVWVESIGASVGAGLFLLLPFFKLTPWDLYGRLKFAATYYKYSAFHAYNFWGMFNYNRPDNGPGGMFLGVDHQIWGFILFAVAIGVILYVMRRSHGVGALALGTALCYLAFYIFVTRMHERYVFPFFLPFLVACVYYRSATLWASFCAVGLVHFANLYHAYIDPLTNAPGADLSVARFWTWLQSEDALGTGWSTVQVLSFFMFAAFPVILAATFELNSRLRQPLPR